MLQRAAVTRRFSVPLDEAPDEVLFLPEASASDWARIFSHAELWRAEPGDVLVRAGEADGSLWFLAEGAVFVMDGEEVVKTVEAPSVLGEIAFLDGGPRSAGLVAGTEAEVARFDRDAFAALAAEDETLARVMALDLGRIAALRLRAVEAAARA
jgi:CRP/FNR family transcriptional regulator, cyclic AMP receptor protein